MIEILQLPLGPLQTNCYLVACQETNEAVVIDPSWDGRRIAALASERGYVITHILLTHTHFDHVGGLAELAEETNAPIYSHPDALEMLTHAPKAAASYNLPMPTPPQATEMLAEGDVVEVGNLKFEVLFTPGHAPGHLSFYVREHNVIFDGDVLFQRSIGRTDFPGSDHPTLMKNIREKLLVLPDDTAVLSGHGPATSIGQEKQWNPFLQ
ncbi:MBL fold metallo-hydrolase [Candidatus Leptofilum sp.]|uniref:MBL fold metallo-hydrolase n=1 Tax=Candidatus Leptofilum sp. TaxID=3241576 RepID=UPI003B5CBF7B